MALLSVEEALARVLDGIAPTASETLPIEDALGRTLAESLAPVLTQPPFAASAMDGYAVQAADVSHAALPATLAIVGTASAGHPHSGPVNPGEAVRIFTGAPVPDGADAVVIQESTARDGGKVIMREAVAPGENVRAIASDFRAGGDPLLPGGCRLGPRELGLAAAMGHATVAARRRPLVAILSTGDELVPPGKRPGAGQIVASNHLCIGGLAEMAGAEVRQLGIARDTHEDLARRIAEAEGADILVTIGGASVGDHDLVAPVLNARGAALAFWKINMRPGKPLMFGRLGRSCVLGLPGNPASALVGARLFLFPLVWALLGRPVTACVRPVTARLARALAANGVRQRYMTAVSAVDENGGLEVSVLDRQHSSLIAPLAAADCLVVRPPHAGALPAGDLVPTLRLDVA
jgi:molybdopterin molybdotransferase